MIHRKTYQIENWADWDHCIDSACKDFNNVIGIFPNILRANRVTLQRIDVAANKAKVKHSVDGTKCGKYKCVNICEFIANDYELDFCLDDKLSDNHFSLLYDSHPEDDDGEPVPEEDNVEDVVGVRVAEVA